MKMANQDETSIPVSPATMSQNYDEEDLELKTVHSFIDDIKLPSFVPKITFGNEGLEYEYPEAVQNLMIVPPLLFDEQANAQVLFIRQRKYGKVFDDPLPYNPITTMSKKINWLRLNAPYPTWKKPWEFDYRDVVYLWQYVGSDWEMTEWVPGEIPKEILLKVYLQDCFLEYKPFEYTNVTFETDFNRYVRGAHEEDRNQWKESFSVRVASCLNLTRHPEGEKEFRRDKYRKKHTERDDARMATYWREKFEKLEAEMRKKGRKKNHIRDSGARKPEANIFSFVNTKERVENGRNRDSWMSLLTTIFTCISSFAFKVMIACGPIGTTWMIYEFFTRQSDEARENAKLARMSARAREARERMEERSNAFLRASNDTDVAGVPDVTSLLSDFAGAMTILSTADSWKQVCIQLAGIAMLKFNRQHADFIEKMFSKYVTEGIREYEIYQGRDPDARKPEGPLGDLSLKIRELRSNTITLKETPVGKALVASMVLFSYTYYADENGKVDLSESRLAKLMEYCDLQVRCGKKDMMGAFFDVAEFALHFADAMRHNPQGLGVFLFPQTVSERFAYLKEHIAEYENGNLEHKFKIDPAEFFNKAVSLEVDLKIMLDKFQRKKLDVTPSMQAMYTQYFKQTQEYLVRMRKAGVYFTFRRRCLAVALTGKSGVGKSSLSEQIIHNLGAACDFPHGARDVWNAKDGKHDDGLRAGCSVYNFDDVCNGKIGDQDVGEQLMARLVKFINNAVCLSQQAEVENKGTIAYEPELLVLTSNKRNLNASMYTNDLESFFSRLTMFEVFLKPEFEKNGRVDKNKASIKDPIHLLQEYTCSPSCTKAPDGNRARASGRDTAEVSNSGIDVSLVGERMSSEDFMSLLVRRYELNKLQQTRLVKDYEEMKETPTCEQCKLFTHWCRCKERVHNERAELLKAGYNEADIKAWFAKLDAERAACNPVPQEDDLPEAEKRKAEAFLQSVASIPGAMMLDIVARLATIKFPRMRSRIGNCIANAAVGVIAGACRGFYEADVSQKMTTVASMALMAGAGLYPTYLLFEQNPNMAIFCVSSALTGAFLVMCHVKDLAAKASIVMIEDYIKKGVTPLTVSFRVLAIGIGLRAAAQTVMNLTSATNMTPQASLMPSTLAEARKKLESEDYWKLPIRQRPPKNCRSKEHAWNAIAPYFIRIGGNCLAYALSSNVFLIPKHLDLPEGRDLTVSLLPSMDTNKSKGKLYGRFDIPDKDFSIIRYTNSVNIEGGIRYLPRSLGGKENYKAAHFYMLRNNQWKEFNTSVNEAWVSNGSFNTDGSHFAAYGYKHRVATEDGDCMSPLLPASAPFDRIMAFHAGGSKVVGKIDGCAYALTQEDALAALKAMDLFVPQSIAYDETAMEGYPLKEVTGSIHERAVCNYIPIGTENVSRVKLLGGVPTSSVRPKSQLVPSFIHHAIRNRPNRHGPPQFQKNRNYAEYFQKSLAGLKPIDPVALEWAVQDYLLPLRNAVDMFPWEGDAVISFDQAVNGIDGNRFVSSLNLQTAGGPGYGKKVRHFDVVGDQKVAHGGVMEATEWLLGEYQNGNLVIPRFSTGLKDEATLTFEVAGKNKVRIFFVAPTHFLLVGKMLFAKIHSFLMTFPQYSELMGSLCHHNSDWSELTNYVTKYDYLFDGDYSKYDTRQTKQTFDAARDVFVGIGRMLGYEHKDVRAISLYMDAICHASMEFNGVLLEYSMWMKSGVWITLLLNGVTNSLLVRTIYYNMGLRGYFRNYVSLAIQGDDMCGSTCLPEFNMLSMSREFANIGMPFTSATKQNQNKPFLELHEMSFCSRRFVYNDYFAEWEAPLEMDSIWKSLFWHMSGGDLTSYETIMGDVWTKLIELTRHGEQVYAVESERLFEALERVGVSRSHLDCPTLTFKGIIEWRKLNHYADTERKLEGAKCDLMHTEMDIPPKDVQAKRTGYHMKKNYVLLTACVLTVSSVMGYGASSPSVTRNCKFRMSNSLIDFNRQASPEEANKQVHNVVYTDHEPGWISGGTGEWEESQDIARDRHTNDSILERPVQIAQYEWIPGSGFNKRFNPWTQVCEDSAVINRLALHMLLKCDLHLTFMINGGPFYYGRLLAGYNYMQNEDNYTLTSNNNAISLMQLSQLPNVILDPRANEGGSLLCPFVWRNHSLEVPANEWQQMGELYIQELVPLEHANDSTDPVTITIFGALKNVHLSVPTSELPTAISPQGPGEYGMISGPLQTAADFAGTLEEVPYIGKYARATQMMTSVGAKVAKMFGFSSPRVEAIGNCVQQPNLATTDEEFRGTSLAITGKRETTIDPRIVGAPGVDELAISSIATRWSYLTQFDWSTTDGASESLFHIDVTPMLGALLDTTLGQQCQLTPMGFAALPFGNWTGEIEFKFTVVCSAHHRGKLRFTHDPWAIPAGNGVVTNRNEISIVDIKSTTEHVMEIGWSQATNWLPTLGVGNGLVDVMPGYSTAVRPRNFNANGQIGVTVLNGLTAPAAGDQSITVLVHARAGKTFKVHDPQRDNLIGFSLASVVLPDPGDPPNQSPPTDVADPDPLLIQYSGDPRGYIDDFAANGADAVPNIGVNNADSLVLRIGSNGVAVRASAPVGSDQSFQLRLRNTSQGSSTLSWTDLALGAVTETFNGIGDTKTITVTLAPGGREGVVFWNYTWTSTSRLAIENLTTMVPETLQLNKLTASQLAGLYTGTLVNGEFVFTNDTLLALADAWPDGSVNLERLSNGFYETLLGTNNVNEPWLVAAGTGVSAIYFLSEASVPQSAEFEEREGDEGNPETDHIDVQMHQTPMFNDVDVFFGEPCVSFRTLLHRFEEQYLLQAQAAADTYRFGLPLYPNATVSGNIPEALLNGRFSNVNSLYKYIRSAYVCERGSTRIKVLYVGGPDGRMVQTVIRRQPPGAGLTPLQTSSGGSGINWGGTGYSYSVLTGEASFELPWYNFRRFFPARLNVLNPPQYAQPQYLVTLALSNGGAVSICYATADDYQLSVFTHVPAFNIG